MKVYVITRGCYSDYHIVAICSNKEKAKECMLNYYLDINDIEEWELDDYKKIPNGLFPYEVIMDKDGNSRVNRASIECFSEKYVPYGDNVSMIFFVFAKDEKHAVKIANEKRSYLIASNLWETDFEKWRKNE